MEGAGLCGDPVVQRSAVPGSSLRVLTMPSVGAQDPSHYGLESSCPQTKPSPLRVPSGESGHYTPIKNNLKKDEREILEVMDMLKA